MVIQRWQSVFLLLAAILMGFAAFVPFGWAMIDGSELTLAGGGYPLVLVTSLLGAALFLLDIFMFKNFKRQKNLLVLAALIAVGAFVEMAYFNIAAITNNADLVWGPAGYLAVAAVLCAIIAMRRIRADERLLRSYDRIR